MIFLSTLTLLVAIAIPFVYSQLSSVSISRLTFITFIYAAVLAFNTLDILSIGSGIGLFNGLFTITNINQFFDIFIFGIASFILLSLPLQNVYYWLIKKNKDIEFNLSPYLIKIININNLSGSALPSAPHTMNQVDSSSNNKNKLDLKENNYSINKNDKTNKSYLNTIKGQNIKIIDRSNYPVEYCLIILFSILGQSLLISSSDLVSMYLSLELQSFAIYVLATLYRDSEAACSAGLKYFLLGALSSCFILLGAGLIYSYIGITNFESIFILLSVLNNINSNDFILNLSVNLGFILIIIGLLFKIGAAPLHNWLPDVYDLSPNIVTTWLTIMPKISIFILLLEIYNVNYQSNSLFNYDLSFSILPENFTSDILFNNSMNQSLHLNSIKNLLLISSLLSLIIGTIVGLGQIRIKRLLGYSTISHIGFILLALLLNTEQSIESFIFYILQYSLTNLNIFLIILGLGYIIHKNWSLTQLYFFNDIKDQESDIKYLGEFRSQFFANPAISLCLTICLFSMAGVPPLIGFFSKQFVLYSCIQNGYYFMSLICIVVSVISASYYLKIVKLLHLEDKDGNILESNKDFNTIQVDSTVPNPELKISNLNKDLFKNEFKLSNIHSFIISVLTLSILLFVLKPSLLLNSTQLLSLSLYNF